MNAALGYLVQCADQGDLDIFLRKNGKKKESVYKGNYDLNIFFSYGKVTRVTHKNNDLKIVEL